MRVDICCGKKETLSQSGVIDAPVETQRIRQVYNFISHVYFLATPLEKKARMRGIELAMIKPGDRVLEVAVGLGQSFEEILKRVGLGSMAYGVDLSPAMLEKARKRVSGKGYANFDLREGDARHLPFPDETFDVLYNSYMLDLIPIADLPVILGEYKRVLKEGGRIVLVNFSKKDSSPVFYEKMYRMSPYFWGGCRPVLMESFVKEAGFVGVTREWRGGTLPTEIVCAIK